MARRLLLYYYWIGVTLGADDVAVSIYGEEATVEGGEMIGMVIVLMTMLGPGNGVLLDPGVVQEIVLGIALEIVLVVDRRSVQDDVRAASRASGAVGVDVGVA